MSLDYLLLGILERPETGYRIKQIFDTVFQHFWGAEISQIYRQLKSLERRGFLQCREEKSPKGPTRRVYRRTEAGRQALREWLAEGPMLGDNRLPYLVQVCFLAELGDRERQIEFFEALREEFEARLRVLSDVESGTLDGPGDGEGIAEENSLDADDIHGLLTLRHGFHRLQALLLWCDESLELLRLGAKPSADEIDAVTARFCSDSLKRGRQSGDESKGEEECPN